LGHRGLSLQGVRLARDEFRAVEEGQRRLEVVRVAARQRHRRQRRAEGLAVLALEDRQVVARTLRVDILIERDPDRAVERQNKRRRDVRRGTAGREADEGRNERETSPQSLQRSPLP